MKKSILTALVLAVALGMVSLAWAGDGCGSKTGGCKGNCKGKTAMEAGKHGATDASTIPYTLDKCIVSGEKLGGMGDPVVKVYDGREVKFCCNGCVSKFEKDKTTYFKQMDDAIVAAQKPTYALTTCPVSGEKLDGGEMKPVDYVYRNQLVRFCCNGCVATFEKNPDKYLAMLSPAKDADKAGAKTEVKTETKTEVKTETAK